MNVSIKMLLKDNNMIYCNILNKCKYKNVTKIINPVVYVVVFGSVEIGLVIAVCII